MSTQQPTPQQAPPDGWDDAHPGKQAVLMWYGTLWRHQRKHTVTAEFIPDMERRKRGCVPIEVTAEKWHRAVDILHRRVTAMLCERCFAGDTEKVVRQRDDNEDVEII